MSDLAFNGDKWGNSTSRTLRAKGLQSDLLAWPRMWSVLGVSEFVGTSYTENRKACGGAMIVDANVLRGLADECVAAAAKCKVLVDPHSALSPGHLWLIPP